MSGNRSNTWLELPYPPLQSVTSVTTYDTNDNPTVVTVADVFIVDTNKEPGRLALRSGQSWPSDTRQVVRIEIIYKVGYGDAAEDVPEDIRMGIINHALWKYEHRGMQGCGTGLLASGAAAEYAEHRIWTL